MIYLIGGPARCGKSTLAERVRKEIDGQVIAGDAFVHALLDNMQPQWIPSLFEAYRKNALSEIDDIDAQVDLLYTRDQVVWPFYESYLKTAAMDASQDDLLIEGNIWPDFLGAMELPYRAVFLVDTSPTQADRLIAIRDSGISDNNWMKNFTNEKMVEWAQLNVHRSQRYIGLCQQLDYVYYDIADHGIEGAQRRAFEYLLQKEV